MKKHSMRLRLTSVLFLLLTSTGLSAQTHCDFSAEVVTGPTLMTAAGTGNRSGVAWNPNFDLYYSVNAGSGTYPIETFSASGGASVASVASGISFRGLWWNSVTNQLEGNGHGSTGIRKQDLDVNGYALGTGSTIFSGQNQPNSQSTGDLDFDANEIIYFDSGNIYRYSRATNVALGNYSLNGMPGDWNNVLSYGVIYTGCPGSEVGVYDYSNRVVYLFDKSNGNFSTSIQLPPEAPQPVSFGLSYANNMIWLFDAVGLTWHSYQAGEGGGPGNTPPEPVPTLPLSGLLLLAGLLVLTGIRRRQRA